MENLKITLTVRQRMHLMNILRQKGRGKRLDDSRQLAGDIFQKIKIPRDELASYERIVPGLGTMTDDAAIEKAPELTVELSRQEARKLKTLIDLWDNFGPDDDEWVNPLVEQLDAKPVASAVAN